MSREIAEVIALYLRNEGYEVEVALYRAVKHCERLEAESPDAGTSGCDASGHGRFRHPAEDP